MQRNLFHRAFSFCLAAVLTVAVLGGIDGLAQPGAAAALMAHATVAHA